MSKFLDQGTLCLYLDQFAACRVFAASVPTGWADVTALIKQGIDAGKFLCPTSLEQRIENTGMDKKSASFLDRKIRKFSSGWCFFFESDVSANYLITKIRREEMQKHHFIQRDSQNPMDESDAFDELARHNEIFREMIKEATEGVNIIRKATQGSPRGKKELRKALVNQIKNYYAEEMKKRMFWLGTETRYVPTPITLAGQIIPFWADVICHQLTSKHLMTQLEAQSAFWILEKEGVDAVPSLSIRASLEAMVAYKGAIEGPNDQLDITRIAAALPFADIMLVDGAKAHDVRELGLDKKFQTAVYSGKKAELEKLKEYLTSIVENN